MRPKANIALLELPHICSNLRTFTRPGISCRDQRQASVGNLSEASLAFKLMDTNGRYIDSKGKKRVQGGADLKMSQHYPDRFGLAISEIFLQNYEDIKKVVENNTKEINERPAKKELKDSLGSSSHPYMRARLSFRICYLGSFIGY